MSRQENTSLAIVQNALQLPLHEVTPQRIATAARSVRAIVGAASHELLLVSAGEGWPADVRATVAGIADPWPRDTVVTARCFSPGALELLRERNANWADASGETRIHTGGGLLVVREGRPRSAAGQAQAALRWSRSSRAIAEFLLSERPEEFHVGAVAVALGWSLPQVSNVLQAFDARGWTRRIGALRGPSARRVPADLGSLLDVWAEHVGQRPRERVGAHRVLRDPSAFLHTELAPALAAVDWAATTWAGLELLAPFATATPVLHLLVEEPALADGRLERVLSSLRLRRVEEGARIEFWAAEAGSLGLAGSRDGVRVVSPPRLYADLLALGGRAEDAAVHVRETLFGF